MIDKDSSGTLTKTEIVKAVAEDKDVVKFLRTCGEENLQFLLVPARLEKALEVLDTSKDGEVDIDEWEEAIHRGLAKRLEQLAEERERRERAARAEDEAFTAQFLNAAREVFLMIDKDDSGSLDKAEVIKAVKTDKKVINFLVNCGNENLQYRRLRAFCRRRRRREHSWPYHRPWVLAPPSPSRPATMRSRSRRLGRRRRKGVAIRPRTCSRRSNR